MMRIEETSTVALPATTHEIREAVNLTIYKLFDQRDSTLTHEIELDTGAKVRTAEPLTFRAETLKVKLSTAGDTVTVWTSVEVV